MGYSILKRQFIKFLTGGKIGGSICNMTHILLYHEKYSVVLNVG